MKKSQAKSGQRGRKEKHPSWEHPKGSGIKIAEIPNRHDGRVYGVSYQIRIPGRLLGPIGERQADREIHQRGTRDEAERLAEERVVALRKHGTAFATVSPRQQQAAAMAVSTLQEHNERLGLKLKIVDVVEAGIRVLSPAGGVRTFAEVAAEMRESKRTRMNAGGLDPSSESDFRRRSERLEQIGLASRPVAQLVVGDVIATLNTLSKTLGQRSVLNFRNTLAEILRYAKAKQYSPTNPMENFTKEDLKRLGGEKAEREIDRINILSVDEARRLLKAAVAVVAEEPGMLATLVLRLFCGLRTGEVSRLDWQEVHWLDPRPYVHIPAGKAKKRRIRQVDIPPNAVEWLRLLNPPTEGPVDPLSSKTYSKRFGRIARAAGIGHEDKNGNWISEWEFGDTRHSFTSYHFKLHGDSIRTATQLGHKQNDNVLFAHYRELITDGSAAEAYFGLVPEKGMEKAANSPAKAMGV